MLIMTAKVDKRKIILVIAVVAAAIGIIAALCHGASGPAPTAAPTLSTPTTASDPTTPSAPAAASAEPTPPADNNDARVKFLTDLGWDVTASPTESMQVKIPKKSSEVFDRYNALQKSQGFDLSDYAGKSVMRYVYQINNYPNATEPVYASILVYKDQIIGGDVTNTAPNGKIQGFSMPDASAKSSAKPSKVLPEPSTEPAPQTSTAPATETSKP